MSWFTIVLIGMYWLLGGALGYVLLCFYIGVDRIKLTSDDFFYCCGFCDDYVKIGLVPLVFCGPLSWVLLLAFMVFDAFIYPFLSHRHECFLGRKFDTVCRNYYRQYGPRYMSGVCHICTGEKRSVDIPD